MKGLHLFYVTIIIVLLSVSCQACPLVIPQVDVQVSNNYPCAGETVTFDASDSICADSGVLEYTWIFPPQASCVSIYGSKGEYAKCKFSANDVWDYYHVNLKVTNLSTGQVGEWVIEAYQSADCDDYRFNVSSCTNTWYVSPTGNDENNGQSWSTAFQNIQTAIDSAKNNDEIIVKSGNAENPAIYYEQLDMKDKILDLHSEYPDDWTRVENTIIDGNKQGPAIIFRGSETPNCQLKGFTVTGGHPEGEQLALHLEFSANNVANDSSDKLRDGTLNGSTWMANGRLGGAMSFDGIDDYIEIDGYKGIVGRMSRTCSAWIKTTQTSAGIICSWGKAAPGQKWMFGMESTGELTVGVWGGKIKSTGKVNDDCWHHVAAVLQENSPNLSQIELYIDGVRQTTTCLDYVGYPPMINTLPAETVHIGARFSDDPVLDPLYYHGRMDDVRIYSRALSEDDVLLLYQTCQPEIYQAEPFARWEFESADANHQVQDIAGYGITNNLATLAGDAGIVSNPGGSGREEEHALSVDGAGYAVMADDADLNPTQKMTISYWLYRRSIWAASIHKYASCPGEPASPGPSRAYSMSSHEGGTGVQVFKDAGVSDTLLSTQVFPLNTWHHVVFTFDRGKANLYLDGELSASKMMTVTTIMDDAQPLMIGAFWSYCGTDNVHYTSSSLFDDVRLYHSVLTARQARQLYLNNGETVVGGGIYGHGSSATISNCIIKANTRQDNGGGVTKFNGSIKNCIFTENAAGNSGGAAADCNGSFISCTIIENTASLCGGGLYRCNGSVISCVIAGNQSTSGAAFANCQASIVNCTIVNNTSAGDAAIEKCPGVIKNCIFWGNSPTHYLTASPTYSCIQGYSGNPDVAPFNFGSDPLFVNPAAGDYHIKVSPLSPCFDKGDPDSSLCGSTDIDGSARVTFSRVDVGADEFDGVQLVDKGVLGSIQKAIDRAADGDVIIVAPGTYQENIDFKGKRITIRSSNPSNEEIVEMTIIQGGPDSHIVSFANGESQDAKLCGFTITDNGLTGDRAGIYCFSSSPVISDCRIENIHLPVSSSYNYGAVRVDNATPRLERCLISGSSRSGIHVHSNGNVECKNCQIVGNAQCGVYLSSTYGIIDILNSVIANNGENGINGNCERLSITNCTVANNMQYGIHSSSTQKTILNSIIWENGYSQLNYLNSSWNVSYCCLSQSVSDYGVGNISSDPSFVNASAGDYHLQPGSLCIDGGAPYSPYGNEPSPNGSRVNIGAYGNTAQAELTIDSDDDGMNDNWEELMFGIGNPAFDPNSCDPAADPESDGFSNWIEYLFGYNPAVSESNEPNVIAGVYGITSVPAVIDPTQGQQITINYLINTISDVTVQIKLTRSPNSTVWSSTTVGQSAGHHSINWDGYSGGFLVSPDVYDVYITVTSGTQTASWNTAETGTYSVEFDGTDRFTDASSYNPYANLPAKVYVYANTWFRVTPIITEAKAYLNYTDDYICYLAKDHLCKPGVSLFEWDGRWGDPSDPGVPSYLPDGTVISKGQLCPIAFNVAFATPQGGAGASHAVNKGGVIVHYEKPIQNVRCNPFCIVPVHHEIVTITYDLICDSNVTVDIYEPDGSYLMTLINDQFQQAGKQTIHWYGRTTVANDPAQTTPDAGIVWYGQDSSTSTFDGEYLIEGDYRVVISSQELNTTVTGAIRVRK